MQLEPADYKVHLVAGHCHDLVQHLVATHSGHLFIFEPFHNALKFDVSVFGSCIVPFSVIDWLIRANIHLGTWTRRRAA